MQSLNPYLINLPQSATIALSDKIRGLIASGRDLVSMTAGDPDFSTPAPILEAANRSMQAGNTHYANSKGLPRLREVVSDRTEEMSGAKYDPATEVLITHGGVHAYHTALQTIMNSGDEVLIADPTWPTHYNMIQNLKGKPVPVVGLAENKFFPTIEAFEEAVTDKTIALVLNSPSNPTGMIADREYMQAVLEFAQKHNLYVISDEVYDRIIFDGREYTSFVSLEGAKERTLLVNSFSKTYAMTGWRVGFLMAPKANIDLAIKASQNSITCVAPFVQDGAICAMTDPAVEKEVQNMVDAYARRRQLVMDVYANFPDNPIKIQAPEGAFYFFIDGRDLGMPTTDIVARLLDEASVAVVPGEAYGKHGTGFMRATCATSDENVERGFNAILEWAAQQK